MKTWLRAFPVTDALKHALLSYVVIAATLAVVYALYTQAALTDRGVVAKFLYYVSAFVLAFEAGILSVAAAKQRVSTVAETVTAAAAAHL